MTELGPVLSGCRVLVTAQRRADELSAALVRRGAEVVVAPTLGVVPHVDEAALVAATRAIIDAPVDVLVVTTGIGFRGWLDAAEAAGLCEPLLRVLADVRLVARGPKARGALQAAGLRADWVAESETSAEIAEFLLAEGVQGRRIAVQRHGAGDDGLRARLEAGGAQVTELEVYRWGPAPDPERLAVAVDEVARGEYDAVVFTSAPGAAAWIAELRRRRTCEAVAEQSRSGALLVAAVGPVTAEPLQAAGFGVLVPDRWRMGALVRLLIVELGGHAGIPTVCGTLRLRAGGATLDHSPLPLSPSGLAVLRRLARRPGEVVSREQLVEVLPGDAATSHAAEVAIGRLREAIGSREVVRTVVKRGYALGLVAREDGTRSSA